MKTSILALVTVLSMQAPRSLTPVTSLAGTWATTFAPPPGNAPVVPPSFTIAIKDGEVLVTFPRDDAPRKATALAKIDASVDQDVSVLLLAAGSTPASRYILRPIGPGQLKLEWYFESTTGGQGRYHEEVFKKR